MLTDTEEALRSKAQRLRDELAAVESEIARREVSPEEIRLAEELHARKCSLNHTDMCGWFYENWERPGYARKRYLEQARTILTQFGFEAAMNAVTLF